MLQTELRGLEERLIDYRPISLLGRGGFASAYLAKDPAGRLVALKIGRARASGGRDVERSAQALDGTQPDLFAPDDRLAGPAVFDEHDVAYPSFGPRDIDAVLEGEYRLLRNGGSEALAAPLELLHRGGRAVLVLEHVRGTPLRALLRAGSGLDPRLFLDLLLSLERIHTRSRLRYHGDLKPEHIIVGLDGRVRLIDPAYRVPLALAPEPLPGRSAAICVTPEYNPFLLTGPPADLFALAVVLYEALTGQLPFPEEETPWSYAGVVAWRSSIFAALRDFLDRPPPDQLNPSAPHELSEAIVAVLRARGEGRDLVNRLRRGLQAAPAALGA